MNIDKENSENVENQNKTPKEKKLINQNPEPAIPASDASNESSSSNPEELPHEDFMDMMPTRIKQSFFGMISQSMKSTTLIDKFNDAHIDKIIENMEKESQRQYDYSLGERRYNCFYVIIVIALFLLLVFAFGPDSEIFKTLIMIASVAAGGFGVGLSRRN